MRSLYQMSQSSSVTAILSEQQQHASRFKFRRNSFAYTTLIVLLFRYECIGGLLAFSESKSVSIVQYFLTSAFLILPLLYMSLFIGHYSKLGCLVFGRIVPLTHGVGYTMVIITVIEAIVAIVLASDALIFFHGSFSSLLPWMECRKQWGNDCIGLNEIYRCSSSSELRANNCFTHVQQLSVYKYRVHTLQQIKSEDSVDASESRFWKKIDGKRLCYLFFCAVVVMLISDLSGTYDNKMPSVIVITYLLSMTIFTVIALLQMPSTEGIFDVFNITGFSLFDSQGWYESVAYFLKVINLSTVGAVLIGSYLRTSAVPDLLAFVVWIGIMALYLVGEFMSGIVRASLASKLNTPRKNLNTNVTVALAIIFPQFFGSLNFSPSLMSALYFFIVSVSSLYRVKLLICTVYHTLVDAKPIIRVYRFYIRVFSCFFLFILAFPVCVKGLLLNFVIMLAILEDCLCAVVLIIVSSAVLYVYRTQTLFDDHHFTYGSQPAIFFKITLLAVPAVLMVYGAMLFLKLSNYYTKEPTIAFYVYSIAGICLSLQLIGLLYIMTYYLKRQNMAHLLKCEDSWGDPNPTTRKERIIYHPRKVTNYFRRIDVCKHECLRYNPVHFHLVKRETSYHNESYRHLKKEQKLFHEHEVGIPKEDRSFMYEDY